MAENRRNRPEYSDDAYTPKPNEPSDPLAELARLIGQSDPFTDTQRPERKPLDSLRAGDRPAPDSRAAPEWLSRPSSTPAHDDYDAQPAPRYADPEPRYQDDDRDDGAVHQDHASYTASGYPDEPQAAPAQAYQADNRYRVAPPPPVDYDDDGYYAEDGHMPPQGEESYAAPARRRGGLITIAAVVGLAVIGTAGAFAYRSFTNGSPSSANPPVIKADPSPAKIVPPTATAAADAQNKPFQDRIGGATAERVVPREEQPVSLPVPPRPTVAAPQTAFAPSPGASNAAPLVAPPAATNPSTNEPKRVRTMTIRQDNVATADPGSVAPQQAPAAAPTRGIAVGNAKQQSGPMAIAPPPDAAPSARSKVAARTPPAQAAGGAYVVQVSAQKTEDEAKASYQSLQQKYPGVLGGREASIRRADLGDKGVYYRAQVGPFASAEAATSFCTNLKNAGGQCIVQKN
jgi:hypothetical protein